MHAYIHTQKKTNTVLEYIHAYMLTHTQTHTYMHTYIHRAHEGTRFGKHRVDVGGGARPDCLCIKRLQLAEGFALAANRRFFLFEDTCMNVLYVYMSLRVYVCNAMHS